MKNMTDYEMWKYLAKLWSKPKKDPYGYCIVMSVEKAPEYIPICWGVCHCISDLFNYRKISSYQYNVACKEIALEKKKSGEDPNGYIWKCDKKGAKSRQKFCERMAEKYMPKKTVKKPKVNNVKPAARIRYSRLSKAV